MALPKIGAAAAAVPLGIGKAGIEAVKGSLETALAPLNPMNLVKTFANAPIIGEVKSSISEIYGNLIDSSENDDAVKDNTSKTASGVNNLFDVLEDQTALLQQMLDIQTETLTEAQRQRIRDLEAQREAAREQDGPSEGVQPVEKDEGALEGLLPKTLFAGILGALAGFRGWEMKAIDRLTSLFDRLRANVVNAFKPITQSIGKFFSNIKASAFRALGLGVDGKPVVRTPGWVKALRDVGSKIGSFFTRIKDVVMKILSPILKLFSGIGSVAGSIAKGAAAVLRFLGPVGLVIGSLFSLFEGFQAFRDKEGSILEKVQAGISATLSDFFGAPLDLIKDLASWIIGKFGFDETSEFLDSFSIEDELEKVFNSLFDSIDKVFEYIKGIFTGETNVLGDINKLWNDTIAQIKKPFDNMFSGLDVSETLKAFVRSILPEPQGDGITGFIGKNLIPREVYEYAGINPDTGERESIRERDIRIANEEAADIAEKLKAQLKDVETDSFLESPVQQARDKQRLEELISQLEAKQAQIAALQDQGVDTVPALNETTAQTEARQAELFNARFGYNSQGSTVASVNQIDASTTESNITVQAKGRATSTGERMPPLNSFYSSAR